MVDFGISMCVRWKVMDFQTSPRSPAFNFQGKEWYFTQTIENASTNCLALWYQGKIKNILLKSDSLKPFRVMVHIQKCGRIAGHLKQMIIPGMSTWTDVTSFDTLIVWRKNIDEYDQKIHSQDMNEFDQGFVCETLRFLVVLMMDNNDVPDNNSTCMLCNSVSADLSITSDGFSLESLSNDFSKYLYRSSNHDVELQCGGRSFKAHRAILCARSCVLDSMLTCNMMENNTGVIDIQDVVPEILERFLLYLYSGKSDNLTVDIAMGLYEVGDKYAVASLTKRCSKFVVDNLTAKDVLHVLAVADAHGDAEFMEAVQVKSATLGGKRKKNTTKRKKK